MSGRTRRPGPALHRRFSAQDGAIALMTAVLMVVLLGVTALAYDLAHLRHQRQVLQDAVDLSALAGAQLMPVRGAQAANLAVAEAQLIAHANSPGLPIGNLIVHFSCVVSDPEGNGGQDSLDVPGACGPAVAGAWTGGWTTALGRATHACDPYAGDLCNSIVVSASDTVQFYFAPVMGFNQGSTGSVSAASCRGFCGQPSTPLDVVIVFDRTGSMTDADIQNAINGAEAVLQAYDPRLQHVGFVALPYGDPATGKCLANDPQIYPNSSQSPWEVTPLSSDYLDANGALNRSSALVQRIECMHATPRISVIVDGVERKSAGHTNLGDPMSAARSMLASEGRPDVPDVIIFETDGEANQPFGHQPCQYFVDAARAAKTAGVDVFTLGFGVGGARCTQDTGFYGSKFASISLSDAAAPIGTPSGALDNQPGSCSAQENTDGDNYFCEPGTADLEAVFRQIAVASLGHSRLVA
jgi:hypothetical protein